MQRNSNRRGGERAEKSAEKSAEKISVEKAVRKWLVRTKADGNLFDSLRWSRDELPFHDGGRRAFGKNGIASDHVNAAYLTLRTNRSLQSNQATDLSVPQQIGILRFDRDQNFAIGLRGFLGQQSRSQSAGDAKRQGESRGRDAAFDAARRSRNKVADRQGEPWQACGQIKPRVTTVGHESTLGKITKVLCGPVRAGCTSGAGFAG